MILSKLIFDTRTEDILRIPIGDMRQIIKTELKLEKFCTVREQKYGREQIE